MDGLNEQAITRHLDDYCREQTRIMNEVKGGSSDDKWITKELQVITAIINGLIKLRDIKKKKSDKL
jgi:hypothetical protein